MKRIGTLYIGLVMSVVALGVIARLVFPIWIKFETRKLSAARIESFLRVRERMSSDLALVTSVFDKIPGPGPGAEDIWPMLQERLIALNDASGGLGTVRDSVTKLLHLEGSAQIRTEWESFFSKQPSDFLQQQLLPAVAPNSVIRLDLDPKITLSPVDPVLGFNRQFGYAQLASLRLASALDLATAAKRGDWTRAALVHWNWETLVFQTGSNFALFVTAHMEADRARIGNSFGAGADSEFQRLLKNINRSIAFLDALPLLFDPRNAEAGAQLLDKTPKSLICASALSSMRPFLMMRVIASELGTNAELEPFENLLKTLWPICPWEILRKNFSPERIGELVKDMNFLNEEVKTAHTPSAKILSKITKNKFIWSFLKDSDTLAQLLLLFYDEQLTADLKGYQ